MNVKVLDGYTARVVLERAASATCTVATGGTVVVKVSYAQFDYCVEVRADRAARVVSRHGFSGRELLVAVATPEQDAAIRARLRQLA